MKSAKYIARVSFRVEPELRERLEQRALDYGTTFGDLTRRAIERGLMEDLK